MHENKGTNEMIILWHVDHLKHNNNSLDGVHLSDPIVMHMEKHFSSSSQLDFFYEYQFGHYAVISITLSTFSFVQA